MTLAFLLPLSCNISPNVSDNVEPTLSSDALAEKLKLSNTYTQIVDLFLNRRDQLKSKSITVDVAKIRSLEQIAKQAKTEVELEKAFKLCYKTGGSDSWKFFMQTSQLFEQLVREIPALRRATSNDLKDAFQKAAQGELNSTIRTESALDCMGTCNQAYNAAQEALEAGAYGAMAGCVMGTGGIGTAVCAVGVVVAYEVGSAANLENLGACMCGCGYQGGCV